MFRKKSVSDELFLFFLSKVQNLTVLSIIDMIRIRFFGPRVLIQKGVRAAQYWKSRLRVSCIKMEFRSKLIPWRTMNLNLGLWSAGERRNTSKSIHSLRRSDHGCGEARCDKTVGTIHCTIIFALNDCCADRSAEVERHSCRWLRWQGILAFSCLEDNDPNNTTTSSSS